VIWSTFDSKWEGAVAAPAEGASPTMTGDNQAAPWNLVMIPRAAQVIPPEKSQIANVAMGSSHY